MDVSGLVKHTSGRTIECGKGCTIRIDSVLNEKTGVRTRHLHWECRRSSGACGENGDKSHGGSWDDVPENVKECALKNGFSGAPAPAPSPTSAQNPQQPYAVDPETQQQAVKNTAEVGIGLLLLRILAGAATIL